MRLKSDLFLRGYNKYHETDLHRQVRFQQSDLVNNRWMPSSDLDLVATFVTVTDSGAWECLQYIGANTI